MRRAATSTVHLALTGVALSLTACGGGTTQGGAGDAATVDGGSTDGTIHPPIDGGPTPVGTDSALQGYDAGGDSYAVGGGNVDAGYYYGDGSFWVDGGAYPNLPDAAAEGGMDAGIGDASSGCGALASCCATLTGATQALCNTVAGSGDAMNCTTELTQLQAQGFCTGVAILASQIQVPPSRMVSDGRLLFWTTDNSSPGLLAMPVRGGPITVLVSTEFPADPFLAVDDINLYVETDAALIRIPKDGSPPTLINETGTGVNAATSLGGIAYWLEPTAGDGNVAQLAVMSAPLPGNTITRIATVPFAGFGIIAVTSSTVFLGSAGGALFDFPLSGVPANGPSPLGYTCDTMTSDANAVYCAALSGSDLTIASDGTASPLGPTLSSSDIAFDDTSVYWVDKTTVGEIKKAPKAGSGNTTVLALATNPTAVAVDANSVYWSDQEGYIKSIAK